MTTAESAMLKDGQMPISIKSVMYPMLSRSTRLPMVPPSSNARDSLPVQLLLNRKRSAKKKENISRTIPLIITKMVIGKNWSWNRPKAAPVLWTRVKRKSPVGGKDCPGARLSLIQALLNWSIVTTSAVMSKKTVFRPLSGNNWSAFDTFRLTIHAQARFRKYLQPPRRYRFMANIAQAIGAVFKLL